MTSLRRIDRDGFCICPCWTGFFWRVNSTYAALNRVLAVDVIADLMNWYNWPICEFSGHMGYRPDRNTAWNLQLTAIQLLYKFGNTTQKHSFHVDALKGFSKEKWLFFPRLLPNLTLNEILHNLQSSPTRH